MADKLGIRGAVVTGAFLAAALLPGAAWALGLGQIHSDTRIGQPFQARIPILAASTADLQGLTVGLANPSAYQKAGIAEPDFLFDLKFSVQQGPSGPYVLVTSQQPTRLPFLNLLVHASWSSGEVTRQYTVLLNPPVFAAGTSGAAVSAPSTPVVQQAVPATAPAAPAPAQSAAQTAVAASQAQPAAVPAMQQATPAPQRQVQSYGPVPRGATLWGLAHRLRPDTGVSINQMMIALYRANPQAFVGNINRLKAGYVLRVPGRSEIVAISTADATQNVARQDAAWQQGRTAVAAQPTPPAPPASAAASSAAAGGAAVASRQPAAPTASPASAGRVLLTTPEVTATQAAAAPGTAAGKATAGAAGAMVAAATPGTKGGAAAGTGASVGGPAKIKSGALANLAATKSQAAAATAATQAAAQPAHPAAPTAKAANSVNSVNSVNTANSPPESSTPFWQQWLTSPPGWIAIAGALLVLLAFLLVLRRRRAAAAGATTVARRGRDGGGEAAGAGGGEESGGGEEAAAPVQAEGGSGRSSEDELGTETYIGGPAPEIDQGDPVAEAEFHAGYGEYDEAVRILRDALARQPEGEELRRKLLEVLFAAGDAQGFRAEAQAFRGTVAEDSEQWSDVAVMGRRLLPDDALFAEGGTGKGGAKPAEAESLDFDMELDRLSGTASADASQDEFERTMDELSTFIETYVPGSGETPLELQLPPQEQPAAPAAEPTDEVLEFTPDEGEALGGEGAGEPAAATTASGGGAEEEPLSDENVVDTKLDLARAYIDMGDPESARSVLEEVVDEGDETQRGEAQRLLESLS